MSDDDFFEAVDFVDTFRFSSNISDLLRYCDKDDPVYINQDICIFGGEKFYYQERESEQIACDNDIDVNDVHLMDREQVPDSVMKIMRLYLKGENIAFSDFIDLVTSANSFSELKESLQEKN